MINGRRILIPSNLHKLFHFSNKTLSNVSWNRNCAPNMSQRALGFGSECPPLKEGVLRLYSMRFCPYAQRTRLVLEHKNIPYEEVNINLKYKPDWFLQKNPLGLVPVLEKDGKVLYESVVCDDFLDEMYPATPLYPTDPYVKARQKIMMEIYGKMTKLLYKLIKAEDKSEHEEPLSNFLSHYEKFLKQKYFGGNTPGMLDLHIWPWIERMEVMREIYKLDAWPKSTFPKLNAWIYAMKELPAVQATYMKSEWHARFFQSFASGTPDYDYGLDTAKL